MVTPSPDKPDKIVPDRARQKKWLVLSGFLHQKFAGKLKEVGQIVPDSTRISLCLQKRQNLVLSGQLLSSFLQTSGAGSQIEPAIFLSGSVWDDFVWLVWSWCNHTINIFFESIFEKNKFHYYYCTTYYLRTLWISWVVWLVVVPRWRGAAIGRRPTTARCDLVLKMFAVPVIIL